jgi:hypothetical protein
MPAEFAPVTEVVVIKELEGEKRRTENEAWMVESAMARTAVPVPPPPMAESLSAVPTMHFLDETIAHFRHGCAYSRAHAGLIFVHFLEPNPACTFCLGMAN